MPIAPLLSWVFPSVCEVCEDPVPAHPESGVCDRCRAGIRFIAGPHCVTCGRTFRAGGRCPECAGKSFHFDRVYVCARYEGTLKELLHTYKFEGRKHLRGFLAGLMRDFFRRQSQTPAADAIVAVPLEASKKRTRGFNQSELLGARLGSELGLEDLSRHLKRRYARKAQHRLSKYERAENVRGCFEASNPERFASRNILLVDDILTTGETASECARALKEAGAASVTVLACARVV